MSKTKKISNSEGKSTNRGWPAVVYVWMVGLGILAYVAGQVVLDANNHPVHWLLGFIGLVVGCLIGWIWYKFRGEMKF